MVAYQYQGTLQRIVTIVSILDELFEPTITISLDTPDPGGTSGLTWSLGARIRRITASLRISAWGVGIGSLLVLLHNPG